jgi:hypothetical protein
MAPSLRIIRRRLRKGSVNGFSCEPHPLHLKML